VVMIIWIALGASVGLIGAALAGHHGGLVGSVSVSILGAVLGGLLATSLLHVGGLAIESVVMALGAALAAMLAWHAVSARGGSPMPNTRRRHGLGVQGGGAPLTMARRRQG
jgi:uncharacterized membrane protein YeaQ/YmgE (transglycosylase-associated protein family)